MTLAFYYVALHMVLEVMDAIFVRYDKPLTDPDRAYIRERDREICYLLDSWAPDNHVDHMRSRKNCGPNAYWNLA
ncbi:MAG: hypothetical protein KF831_06375 [Acidobacteria bacterium]|nr:hypothetical protein [Acidobacteriota bacterium]HMQ04289.1 hypothetical protein [Pyrinomonadaceae bacterium]